MKKSFNKQQLAECKKLRLSGMQLPDIAESLGVDEPTTFQMHLELIKRNEIYCKAQLDANKNIQIDWFEGTPKSKKPFAKLLKIFTKQKSNHGHNNRQIDRGAGNETT